MRQLDEDPFPDPEPEPEGPEPEPPVGPNPEKVVFVPTAGNFCPPCTSFAHTRLSLPLFLSSVSVCLSCLLVSISDRLLLQSIL